MSGKTYKGQCHCGEVEWTVAIPEPTTILCHCDTCKILSGSAYTLNQIVDRDGFKLTKGGFNTYTYKGESGKSVNVYFCPTCSAHAYHHQEAMGPDKIVIRTVLLDGGKSFKPAAEIFGKAKMSWEPESAQTFDTMPPS